MGRYILFFGALSSLSFAVNAHPHAFVEMKNKILVENNQLVGFSMNWVLDEASSSEMLYDLALAGEDKQAQRKLADEMMKNIVGEHYFSYLYDQAQHKIKYTSKPRHYGLKAEGSKISYYFEFLLSQPQTLEKNQFTLMTYDPTYYVSMYYDSPQDATSKNAVDFSALPKGCSGTIIEPNVSEQLAVYAQSLDRSQRNVDDSLGAQFAQKVVIVCS
ncbi:zinc transporter binding subunit ZevA [Conservatibacter flavescens]|uniref:zinc transporter binding subunit ZevA n=1 Tax=Conservatibacter flavescens TaxID=28161 RepID=UPI0024346007|nr:zinc transporter binding subunit ZevA [Conservatibacter flavescens]